MFVSRKTFQGGPGGNESITFTFPVSETVSKYTVNTNAINWTLSAVDPGGPVLLDTRMYQYTPAAEYQLPGGPATYQYFQFESNLVQNSNTLIVSSLTFTNSRGYVLSPNLTSNSTFSQPVISSPVPAVIKNGYVYNIGSNVTCYNLRVNPSTSFIFQGSNNGSNWVTLAQNSNACSNIISSNAFQFNFPAGYTPTDIRLYDLYGNDILSDVGGAHRGSGEYIQIDYNNSVNLASYTITTPATSFPTWWVVDGYRNGQWSNIDEQRNVYDAFTTFSNSLVANGYSSCRLTIKATSGSRSAQISSFSVYDENGTVYTPVTTTTSIPASNTFLPTSIPASIDSRSPFIKDTPYVGSSFQITFDQPVALYKVYMDTVPVGLTIVSERNTTVLSTQFNKIAETTNRTPFRKFTFNLDASVSVSNVILFGSLGRLNPVFTSRDAFTHVYGGKGNDIISIKLPPDSSNGNLYSFVSTAAAWKLEGNVQGTWRTLDTVSNVYTPQIPYQKYFTNSNCSEYKMTISEIQPTVNVFYRMNCFQIMSNSFTPMIPLLTSNDTNVTDTLVSSSLVGKFDIQATSGLGSILSLFSFGSVIPIIFSSGDSVRITLPYNKSVRYCQLTCGENYNSAPTQVIVEGSFDGITWSNTLINSALSFSSAYQSKRVTSSNLTPFVTYRVTLPNGGIITRMGIDAHVPNGSTLSYGNEMYGGTGSNQWIQLNTQNPFGSRLSYIKLESNTVLPANVVVTNASGTVVGSYTGYSNIKSINIPVTTSDTLRVTSYESNPNPSRFSSFNVSNLQFYSSKNDKIVASFPQGTPPDPLNNIITVSTGGVYGGEAVKPQSVYINIYPSNTLAQYYVLKSSSARSWEIRGSSDNINWYLLDSRSISDPQVSSQDERSYIFYNNQTANTVSNVYSFFSANISETYSSTDGSVSINEFSILDDRRYRVMKTTSSGTDYLPFFSGDSYNLNTTLGSFNKGDYKIWKFPYAGTFNTVTMTLPSTPKAHVKSFTVAGETPSGYESLLTYNDTQLLGTYVFSGNVATPYTAFTLSGVCNFGTQLPKNVSVTLPYPFTVGYYKVVRATSTTDNFSNPTAWNFYADDTLVSTTPILDSLIPIQINKAQKYTLEITGSSDARYPVYIRNLLLYDTGGNQIYQASFSSGYNYQTIEQYSFNGTKSFTLANTGKTYSNIAIIFHNYFREPNTSNGIAELVNVEFGPTKFRGVGNQYDNDIGDIISGSANVIIYSQSRPPTTAKTVNFTTTNANTWTLYGSTDGIGWTPLTTNSNIIQNPSPASYYKLEVSNIVYSGDGTTNISNVTIDGWLDTYMTSNSMDIITKLTDDTYSTSLAKQVASGA